MPFFKRFYNSIFKIEDYIYFLLETVSDSLKYIIKLTLIISLILTASVMFGMGRISKEEIEDFKTNSPNFTLQNYELKVDEQNLTNENKGYIKKLEKNNIYLEPNITDISELNEKNLNFGSGVYLLKDKVCVVESLPTLDEEKQSVGSAKYFELSYKVIFSQINKVLENPVNPSDEGEITKQQIENTKFKTSFLIYFCVILVIYIFFVMYISFILLEIFGVILITLIANLISSFIRPKMRLSKVFILTVYSSTLGYLLYSLIFAYYFATGNLIQYGNMLYYSITLIYVIAGLYLIKNEFINEMKQIDEQQKKLTNTEIDELKRQIEAEKEKVRQKDKEHEENETKEKAGDGLSSNNVIKELERQDKLSEK